MYELTLDGNAFFAPANERYTFIQLDLHEALNDAGYINAQVPSTNPLYDAIKVAKSKVELFKDNSVTFRGKVSEVSIDFNNTKTLYIVGELSYLSESVQMQQNVSGMSKTQILAKLLTVHNQQSEEKFYPGRVGVPESTTVGLLDYGYTLDIIREVICADNGYIKIVYRNNRREIDILPIEAYGKQSNQYIRFASNLLNYVQNYSGDTITTAILPRGKKLENSSVDGLDSYLTIKSVNDGSEILVNQIAVSNYGYKCKIVDFDTDNVDTLLRLAKAYLTTYQYSSLSLQLTAVDLSMIDSSQDDYDVGDYVRATAEPFNMDAWFPVRKKDTNILDLSQNKIELGLTKTNSITENTASIYKSVVNKMPQQSSILESAKKNATALLNGNGESGNVVWHLNSNGEPYELLFLDTNDINTAVKVWRYNLAGWGYSSNGYKGPYDMAATFDKGFVADFITAGILRSIRIENGETREDGTVPFYVTEEGDLYAENGTFKGDVSAATLGGEAGDTLSKALNDASTAISTADSTAKKANSVAAVASTAAYNASNAASTANYAASTANSLAAVANNTANTANSAAYTASVAASTADSTAKLASTAASTANSAASIANSLANKAETTANATNTSLNQLLKRIDVPGHVTGYYPIKIGNYTYELWGYQVD